MYNKMVNTFLLVLTVLMVLTGCASAPLDYPKTDDFALPDTSKTYLAQASANWRAGDPGQNGFYPLTGGFDAFGARLALMDRAERCIDAQYFLMKPDTAGLVFANKLMAAADRGVRVRFLLDDIFTTVDDQALMLLNQHPNIELRIFNPIARKGIFALNYVGHFQYTNRRMHNKAFIVDNQAAIVGGRNIAEEYFQLETSGEFLDFDMLCAGPIVRDISSAFDRYWNHELAVPMNAFYNAEDTAALDELETKIKMGESGESIYATAIHTELMQKFQTAELLPYFADARIIYDDPQKLLEDISPDQEILATEIAAALRKAEKEVIVFTPYFIPGQYGVDLLKSLSARNVRVTLVTNSLATNNHISAFSAYASHRKEVLRAGVDLWEARVNALEVDQKDGAQQENKLTMHTTAWQRFKAWFLKIAPEKQL